MMRPFHYDPYGGAVELTISRAPDYHWHHLHQGAPPHPDGLVNFRNCEHCPKQGRWVEQDPMGFVEGQGLNEFPLTGPTAPADEE